MIANARMYSVAPGAAAAWKRLFVWVATTADVPLHIIDHAFPAPLAELWARDDLACAFMCGWPHVRLGGERHIVAAPVPSAAYAAGRPVYCSHFAVRAAGPFRTLEDTFGSRFAFTIADSHSGYNAPRHRLMRYRGPDRRPLFGDIVGPLTTPRRVLEAIAEQRADVGPLDSFAFDLLCRHASELTEQVRIVASTELVPIPAFVAARTTPLEIVERLAVALCGLSGRSDQADLLADLCVAGFARLDPATYRIAEVWDQEATAAGLETIA